MHRKTRVQGQGTVEVSNLDQALDGLEDTLDDEDDHFRILGIEDLGGDPRGELVKVGRHLDNVGRQLVLVGSHPVAVEELMVLDLAKELSVDDGELLGQQCGRVVEESQGMTGLCLRDWPHKLVGQDFLDEEEFDFVFFALGEVALDEAENASAHVDGKLSLWRVEDPPVDDVKRLVFDGLCGVLETCTVPFDRLEERPCVHKHCRAAHHRLVARVSIVDKELEELVAVHGGDALAWRREGDFALKGEKTIVVVLREK
mmetsp:Transcript_50160/g.83282  ORF Transcript_50160/g.83282 Transcript_50160/m.83282 type:complete len:258 (+) Transcript_50160:265-1038(+)